MSSKFPDFRQLPCYSVEEAAHYLNIPSATVRYWAKGRYNWLPLIKIPEASPTSLSFLNLVELHLLASIRRTHQVSMPKVRIAIDYLRENSRCDVDGQHPLLSAQLQTDGLNLFVERYGALVNISQDGQLAIRRVLEAALQRIERDLSGIPAKLYPFTRSSVGDASGTTVPRMIVMDPALSAGRPVIAGTGLATEIIAERYKAGDPVSDLATDYDRKEAEIEEAIRCELQAAA